MCTAIYSALKKNTVDKTAILYFIIILLTCTNALTAQNVSINILTADAGIVKKGNTIALDITINNVDPKDTVGIYKLRPQVNVPGDLVLIADSLYSLPEGWIVLQNESGSIRLSNGSDRIMPNDARNIRLFLKAIACGGPSTISGNLLFSNGATPGSGPGVPTKGDTPADNVSTTTVKVIN